MVHPASTPSRKPTAAGSKAWSASVRHSTGPDRFHRSSMPERAGVGAFAPFSHTSADSAVGAGHVTMAQWFERSANEK